MCSKEIMLAAEQAALSIEAANKTSSEKLLETLKSFIAAKPAIPIGSDRQGLIDSNKQVILQLLGAQAFQWEDWRWQLANRIESIDLLSKVLMLSDAEMKVIEEAGKTNRWSITPYYLSLMTLDPSCPIRVQALPALNPDLAQSATARRPGKGRKPRHDIMPVRLTSQCTMSCQYCQFCQVSRNTGKTHVQHIENQVEKICEHLRANSGVKSLLITGGDSLLLDDNLLDMSLGKLELVDQLEVIEIETRVPSTLPQRVTGDLVRIISSHGKTSVCTQFNSPLEITREAEEACSRLATAGISVQNSPTRLKGVNDNPHIMKRLNQALQQLHVNPYRMAGR